MTVGRIGKPLWRPRKESENNKRKGLRTARKRKSWTKRKENGNK